MLCHLFQSREMKKGGKRDWHWGRERERELNHQSNVINDLPICMCWTINHSQVNVTDRRFAFSAANRMKFDNINGIPLFSCTHSFCSFSLCCLQPAGVPLVIKLSPKFARPYIEVGKGREGRKEGEREEPNYFSLFHCQVINKTQLSSSDAQPGASLSHIFPLSTIKYLGIFFL